MGPTEALKTAIRGVLLENEALADLVIGSEIAESDPMPACLITVHSAVPTHVLGPSEAYRSIKVSLVWHADDAAGVAAATRADDVNEITRALLFEQVDEETAQERINRFLAELGWRAHTPLECGLIPEHSSTVGKDRTSGRRAMGYFFDYNLERI